MEPSPTDAEKKLHGGIAVITGAGAGIGAAIARRCGALGMTVIVTDIDSARASSVAHSITSAGGRAHALTVDVSQPSELDRLAALVYSEYGPVRLLVNNAGIETLGYTWEIPLARWEATLNINCHGVVHGCRAFIPNMLESGEECAYIMTKHAVQSFTECLFLELQLKKAKISVSSVVPGMLKTRIFEKSAGRGEGEGGDALRGRMEIMMRDYGMDVDEGCRKIVRGIAEKRFWVDTQEEMTEGVISQRVRFLQERREPEVAEDAKALLG